MVDIYALTTDFRQLDFERSESLSHEDIEYETGFEVGREDALAELETQLVDDGFDPGEVQELLYDPAPRRSRKAKKTTSRRKVFRARQYDPAPKRKITAKRHGKKGTLAKLKKYALPGAAGLTFYAGYVKRATELFQAGKITANSVSEAIKYDFKNFNTTDAMGRLKKQAGEIATPLIAGKLVEETKLLGKLSGVVADVLYGMGVGVGAKAILDPPIPGLNTPRGNGGITVSQTQIKPASQAGSSISSGCPNCTKWEV